MNLQFQYKLNLNNKKKAMKKQHTSKHNKVLSRNPELSRDKNTYSYKELQQTRDMTPINYLQKRLNEQISAREQSYNVLLEMIKRLEETKKSKVPIDFDKNSIRRLLNPNIRQQTGTSLQSQQLIQFKQQMALLKSNKNIQQQKQYKVLKQIIKQVKDIKQSIAENDNNTSKKLIEEQKSQALFKKMEEEMKKLSEQIYLCQIEINKTQKLASGQRSSTKINQIQKEISKIKAQIEQKWNKVSVKDEKESHNSLKLKSMQETMNILKNKANQNEKYHTNLTHLIQQFKIFKQDVIDNQKYLNDKLDDNNLLTELYDKMGSQYLLIAALSSQVSKVQIGLQNFSLFLSNMLNSMKTLEDHIEKQFSTISNQVAKAGLSIEQTKSHLQQIIYGESSSKKDSKNGEKLNKDSTRKSERLTRGQNQMLEKLIHIEARIQSMERRVELIYRQYLSKPLRVKD